jgi:hypothetical protein
MQSSSFAACIQLMDQINGSILFGPSISRAWTIARAIAPGIISDFTEQIKSKARKSGHGFLRVLDKPLRACLTRVLARREAQRSEKRRAIEPLMALLRGAFYESKAKHVKQSKRNARQALKGLSSGFGKTIARAMAAFGSISCHFTQ